MKKVYGEIKFDVSVKGSLVGVYEKINEWTIGNKILRIVDDYGNEIGKLDVHNVSCEWIDELE